MTLRRVAAVLAAVALGASLPAAARQTGASPARLGLASIPSWVQPGGVVTIGLEVSQPTRGLVVEGTLHEALRSRTAFEESLDGGTGVRGSFEVPLRRLVRGGPGTHRLRLDLGPDRGRDGGVAASLPVTSQGIYPLTLELRVPDGTTVDAVHTHLVVIDRQEVGARLGVAWVWPIELARPLAPDGSVDPGVARALRPGGVLAEFTDALAAAGRTPLTLDPGPATLEAWARLAARGGRAATQLGVLRDAVATEGRQVLPGTYARTDLTALAAARLTDEIAAQFTLGAEVVRSVLALRPDPRTMTAPRIDPDALAAVRAAGIDQVVVGSEALVPVFENLTPANPFSLVAAGREFLTAAADRGLARLLEPVSEDDDATPALLAHRFLAGLTMVELEAPGERRGVVVVPPNRWTPAAGTLVTALRGLAAHPGLEPLTLDDWFETVPAVEGENAVRSLVPTEPGDLGVDASAVRSVRHEVDALGRMLPGATGPHSEAERLLLLAETTGAFDEARGTDGDEYLEGARGAVSAVVGRVKLPGDQRVTLTAERARLPITFLNDLDTPVVVKVRLASDRLLFPDGDTEVVELPPRNTTVEVTVEARSTGSFPVTVEVTSPDEVLDVGTVTLTIRSTAVSGVAVFLTVAAGVFLAAWWGNHIRRARARRRAEPA